MELVMPQPKDFDYNHKKFDVRKRRRDEQTDASEATKLNNRLYFDNTDSSSSVESYEFQAYLRDSSTPIVKRRKISPHLADSGIVMTSAYHQQETFEVLDLTCSSDDSSFTTQRSVFSPPIAANQQFHHHHQGSKTVVLPFPPTVLPLVPNETAVTAAVLPKISDDTLRSICKYHGNMVRKFPKKVRSPKDQERRNKNTIACRMSRRVKKLEYIAIEEQYKEYSQQHMALVEESMRSAAYLNELMKLTAMVENNERTQQSKLRLWDTHTTSSQIVKQEYHPSPKKPFTIAYLTGKAEES